MKKSYTKEKRTTVALNPDMTSRIEKVLGKKGMKLSKFVIPVLNNALEVEEQKQLFQELNKLIDSKQYYKIKKLEERIKDFPELKQRLSKVEDQLKYFKEEYEEEEKILNDPDIAREKARMELREMDPELADAYDKAEEIHKKHMYRKYTPKERKELEDDMKRIGKKLRKERKERRKKLFKN